MLISQKLSTTPDDYSNSTFGQTADAVAKLLELNLSFHFIGIIFFWMLTNILMATNAFDPYPFILLNLVLSCVAAIQAPLIMMSQNRQEAKDRERAESDYHVNLKSELIVGDLHVKLDRILDNQKKLQQELNAIRNEIKNKLDLYDYPIHMITFMLNDLSCPSGKMVLMLLEKFIS